MIYCVESSWPKRASDQCVESDWKGPPNIIMRRIWPKRASDLYMRWIWLKRASKYLCVESDQKGPLIYALNLTEICLQIFMHRIWPKRAPDLSVESDWKRPPNIIMRRIWPCKQGLWTMRWIWLKRASKYICVESDQKGQFNPTPQNFRFFFEKWKEVERKKEKMKKDGGRGEVN